MIKKAVLHLYKDTWRTAFLWRVYKISYSKNNKHGYFC